MDFTFSEEQEALRDSVRDFLSAESPPAYWRSMLEDEKGFTPEVWSKLAELGWTGLLVPEAYGGLGMGLVDLVVVMEEMGRVPFPGPFFSSAVFTTLAARALELEDQLRGLAAGEVRGCVALEENGHGDVVGRIRARASRKSGRWRLSGQKSVVMDGHTADFALVAARTQAGMGTFLIENPQARLIPSWDGTRKLASLELDDTPAEPIGPDGDHSEIWRRVVDDTCIALCAELIGACERSSDLAVEYAKERVQFGRPIATFQVIKHKTVDMLHKLELARVGTHYAAWASDTNDPLREEATAMAKAFVPEAANFITGESI
ncbi:MAG: acyl-CoA dehydrogenase family protein, partial [Myxococcota bacterium]|nr:acyl-CoA dehydrogenase family protein [Myxococcota bacterium]